MRFRKSARRAARPARSRAYRRLDAAFSDAKRIYIDDRSRIIFFSDCHRGIGRPSDAFSRNKELFFRVLQSYFWQGFTYIEVGDGDELWQNRRFADVRRAHPRIFDLFQAFHRLGRLHLIVGNHDIQGGRRRVEKDGIVAQEGLVLLHAGTGQEILVVHGHQADVRDRVRPIGRLLVRGLKYLQRLGLARRVNIPANIWQSCKIDLRIRDWARSRERAVICGHTHRPAHAAPYFNSGSCLMPGSLTGIEIRDGQVALVQWTEEQERAEIRRELLAQPRALGSMVS